MLKILTYHYHDGKEFGKTNSAEREREREREREIDLDEAYCAADPVNTKLVIECQDVSIIPVTNMYIQ